mgnify:FL=1
MFGWFRKRQSGGAQQRASPTDYRAFTTKYDREVNAQQLPDPDISERDSRFPAYPEDDAGIREGIIQQTQRFGEIGPLVRPTAVSILLDHSGSLRGEKAVLSAVTAGVLSSALHRIGAAHEVLGFTTRSWRGGQAYQDWVAAGRPAGPGRLCELLHIIYRPFSETGPVSPDDLTLLAFPSLLKENIDGEAVAWALSRLKQIDADSKVLIVVSDGAPVDDATLISNGPHILFDHLQHTLKTASADGAIKIVGIGICHDMSSLYDDYVVVHSLHDIADAAAPALARWLA